MTDERWNKLMVTLSGLCQGVALIFTARLAVYLAMGDPGLLAGLNIIVWSAVSKLWLYKKR